MDIGNIKLTWINTQDNTILNYTIYDTIEQALENIGDKKYWMLFTLQEYEGGDKCLWKTLPYGCYIGDGYKKMIDYHNQYGWNEVEIK